MDKCVTNNDKDGFLALFGNRFRTKPVSESTDDSRLPIPVFYTPVIHTPAKLYSRILYIFRNLESAAFHRFFAFQPSAISAKALKSPDSDCIPIQSVCFAARNELSAKSAARRCHRQSFEPEALREARPGGPLINRIHSENNHVRHKHVSATYDLLGFNFNCPSL